MKSGIVADTSGADPGLVYDVGMNNGDDSAFYLRAGHRVVAVEANPLLCRAAAVRFADAIAGGRLTILNMAISAAPGEIEFWVNHEVSEWSSLDRPTAARAGHPVEAIRVPTDSMDAVIRRHGQPHYLKIDIENADIVCLRALRNLTVPCHVSAELTEEALVRELVGLGYRRFKLVEQVSHLPIGGGSGPEGWRTAFHYALLTRRAIPYRILRRTLGFQRLARWSRPSRRFPGLAFPAGSSGTFGEDIPSGWISADEVLALWRTQNRIWAGYRRDFWSDVHATP